MIEIGMDWRSLSAGRADLVLTLSGEVVNIPTTYIGDGLGSVLQAAVDLGRGSSSAIAMLPAEPGAVCLFLAGAKTDVYLQVVSFADMQAPERRWTGGRLIWAGQVSVRNLLTQAALMAERVLAVYGGPESYAAAWSGMAFPTTKLEALRRMIDAM